MLVAYPVANVVIHKASPVLGIVIFVALLVSSGAVAGYLAARSPLMHGVVLGALVGVVAIISVAALSGLGIGDIGSILRTGVPALISMAVPGIILCALGAVLGDYLRERRRAT
jgi:hypothetical protein